MFNSYVELPEGNDRLIATSNFMAASAGGLALGKQRYDASSDWSDESEMKNWSDRNMYRLNHIIYKYV